MNETVLTSDGVAATLAIGRRLGRALARGYVVALIGPLGAGKTVLVKGIAEGAGVADLRQVNSPTFVIVNEYEAQAPREGRPLRIFHIDAYRLRGAEDLAALGFDELCEEGAVVIEWADRVEGVLPAERMTIRIEPAGDEVRVLRCTANSPRLEAVLAVLTTNA